MAEKPEDLNLPNSVVFRLIKEEVSPFAYRVPFPLAFSELIISRLTQLVLKKANDQRRTLEKEWITNF